MLKNIQNLKRLSGSYRLLTANWNPEALGTLTINRSFQRGLTNQTQQNEQEANFGYERVKYEEKQTKGDYHNPLIISWVAFCSPYRLLISFIHSILLVVNEVFSNVARKYDIMNDAMSFGKINTNNKYEK